MDSIDDKLFGELTYDYGWNGKTDITILNKRIFIDLFINCELNEMISPNQRVAFIEFRENSLEIIKDAEEAILKYYRDVFKDYQAQLDDLELIKEKAPDISTIEELYKLVSPTTLLIDYDFNDNTNRVGILYDCTWEPEHGLAVKIENGSVVKVGFQDIVL